VSSRETEKRVSRALFGIKPMLCWWRCQWQRQKSEVRSQESEVRSQESEVRSSLVTSSNLHSLEQLGLRRSQLLAPRISLHAELRI